MAVVVGLVASPGAAADLAAAVLPHLTGRLRDRLPDADWSVRLVTDSLVPWPADLSQLIGAARLRLLRDGWHLVVCMTELPLQTARRPVVAHASVTHGVAVLCLPALGAVAVNRRAAEAVVRLVAELVGDAGAPAAGQETAVAPAGADRSGGRATRRRHAAARRLQQLGGRMERDTHGTRLVASVVAGNTRLLLGMLRANRPWRLAGRLSRALVTALAAAVFALVSSDVWRLSQSLGVVRLSLLTAGSVVALVLTIVIGAGLWERVPRSSAAREQVVLFNVVTVVTVVIGVLALYLALFGVTLIGSVTLVPEGLLGSVLGRHIGAADVIALAWLASSIATVGGALGAGLESDEVVREAAYSYHVDRQLSERG